MQDSTPKRADELFDALIRSRSSRTKYAQLREHFDRVDQALRMGVSRDEILNALSQLGLELNRNSFNSFVVRLRMERAAITSASATPRPLDGASLVVQASVAALPGVLGGDVVSSPTTAEPVDHALHSQAASRVTEVASRTLTIPNPTGRSLEQVLRGPRPDVFELERQAHQQEREDRAAADAASAAARQAEKASRAAAFAAMNAAQPPETSP